MHLHKMAVNALQTHNTIECPALSRTHSQNLQSNS